MTDTTVFEETPIYFEVREALGDPWLPVEVDSAPSDPASVFWAEQKPA